jgi:hypothetical protein
MQKLQDMSDSEGQTNHGCTTPCPKFTFGMAATANRYGPSPEEDNSMIDHTNRRGPYHGPERVEADEAGCRQA